MFWFLVVLFLGITFAGVSEATHGKKLPSAVVVGTVFCDTCFQQDFPMGSHFMSGASVAVECKEGNSNSRFRKEVKTDEHGEFKVQLPFSVSKHVKRIKGCAVKLINSSEPYCAVASAASSSSLRLKSRKQGEHIFSAGFFSFKPLKQPNLCNQKPSFPNSGQLGSVKSAFPPTFDPSFPPPFQVPTTPGGGFHLLPPLPKLPELPPLPKLPPLPPLPVIPWLPPFPTNAKQSSNRAESTDQKADHSADFFPPNPFQPPPSLPSPLFPFPPIPGLTPPPPPFFGLPFPPLFPPPRSPGTRPASSSKNTMP
ncbi:hypothetical protein L6164_007609 [Bauhinia variegata]|uniref:Uncharacterized protein n=1 Tax=Bauhinia variegata TaxID=167791 RepID=A0ACB9PD66_BAUVA|nr:hypothetical protein L6164_007609 [Bauhinia variegata]